MRERAIAFLKSLALIGVNKPFYAVAFALISAVAFGSLIPGLKISTSRRDLVSEDNPLQKKTLEFDAKFGYPNAPAIVVAGGSKDDRRKLVDAVETELEKMPGLERRVLGRIGPEDIAEVLLLADPESVARAVPKTTDGSGVRQLESGLPGWFQLLDDQLKKGLEGEAQNAEETKEGLDRLRMLFTALDDELSGKGGLSGLGQLTKGDGISRGLDELGYLSGDKEHHIIALFPQLEGDEGYQVRPVVREIRAARDRGVAASGVTGVQADVTGLPALVTDELAMIERDLAVTSTASTIALWLTLFWAFRSFRQSLVGFLPLAFGTLVTFGIVRLVLGKLNLITASFTSVLIGVGDFGIHIQTRYSALLREGKSAKEAMEKAMVGAAPGLILGTLTTAVAFLTTVATEFTAFAELGFITCLGLLLMFIGTYLLVPSVILLLLGKNPRPSPQLPGFRMLASGVRAHPRKIVVVSVLAAAVFAVWVPQIRFNGRYFEFLPPDTESARGLKELESDAVVSPFVANVRATSIEDARRLAKELRALESVASVESASDLFPELTDARLAALKKVVGALEFEGKPADFSLARQKPLDKATLEKNVSALVDTLEEVGFTLRQSGRDDKPANDAKAALVALKKRIAETDAARLGEVQNLTLEMLERAQITARNVVARGAFSPEDLPPLFRHRFVSKDGSEVALFVHPVGDIWDVPVAERFTEEVTRISPSASGIATTLAEHPKMIVRGFTRATVLSGVFVLVILAIGFRRASDVGIASVPLILGSFWMLGSMPLLGLDFNHANMAVLPLLLGLGVESGAQIMSRYRQSAEERGGTASLDDILSSTGSAVFVAGLTTVWGFSVMMFSKYRAMFGLGLIMTIGMFATLFLSMITLPAVLVLLKRAK